MKPTLLIILISFLMSADISLWEEKMSIENSLKDKMEFGIATVLDHNNFMVSVDVTLKEKTVTEYDNVEYNISVPDLSNVTNVNEPSDVIVESKSEDKFDLFDMITGEGDKPETINDKQDNAVEMSTESQQVVISSSTIKVIDDISVTVILDEVAASGKNQQDISEVVCNIIPDVDKCEKDCNMCISYMTKDFPSAKSDKITEMEQKIATMEKANKEAQMQLIEIERNRIMENEKQLIKEIKGYKQLIKEQNIKTERASELRRVRDSIRVAQMEQEIKSDYTSLRLQREQALQARINAESAHAQDIYQIAQANLKEVNSVKSPYVNHNNNLMQHYMYPMILLIAVIFGFTILLIMMHNRNATHEE